MDFWEMTFGLFSYSASHGSTVDTYFGVAWCISTAPCIWQSIVRRCLCLRSTIRGLFWEMTSGWIPYSARYLVRQWIHIYVSLRRLVGFHALREGGPRIPRSILPCPGGCRTNFTHFHCEGGHAPEVDFGYTFMRQSPVAFGRISHIFQMKVDSDPAGELPDDWQSRFLPHFAAFFALRPHGRECPFFSPR